MASKLRVKLEALQSVFEAVHPTLFSLCSPVPLKLGITRDVIAANPSLKPGLIYALFGWLCDRRAYLRACTPGAIRYGLEGPCGVVSEKEAEWAAVRLAERETKAAEVRATFQNKKEKKLARSH